jgi:TRAP-type C4-dicarboxylate transport system substrate-binding protein
MRSASLAIGVATTCLAALLGGCATGPTSKTGVEATVLRFASIDNVNDNGQSFGPQAFVDQLAAVSGGRLKVRLTTMFEDGVPRAEVDLVKEITAGRLDGGWPATRAFAAAGIGHLAAVEAPMTITSYAAQKALATSPVAADLMKTLDGSGAVGLGLTVGPLRRPFASKAPLLGPTDWKGVRFRTFNSPVQAEAVRALGGVPVDLGFTWIDEVRAGRLRGGEYDVAQYVQNGFSTEAGEVTGNVVLWPKMYVLTVSQKRFDSLTRQQQGWVRAAAARAVQASAKADYDETTLSQKMCSSGAHFTTADPDTLVKLHTALEPVIARLASSPGDRNFLKRIQALAAGPADVLAPLAGCRAPADLTGVGPIPDTRSDLPPGVYRVQITSADVAGAGLVDSGGLNGTWTFTVRDHQYQLACRPAVNPGFDCGGSPAPYGPVEAGDLRGRGHDVYLVYNARLLARLTGCLLPPSQTLAGHCAAMVNIRMHWDLKGKLLTFDQFQSDGISDDQYLLKPWQKIA